MLLLPKAHNFAPLNTRRKGNIHVPSPAQILHSSTDPFPQRKGGWSSGVISFQRTWDRPMLKVKYHHSPLGSGKERKDGSGENKYGKLTWRPTGNKSHFHNLLNSKSKNTFEHFLNLDFVNQNIWSMQAAYSQETKRIDAMQWVMQLLTVLIIQCPEQERVWK